MTRTHTYLSIHKLVTMALIGIAIISLFAYVGLTVATIFATAGRSHASREAARLTSHIGDLEGQYLVLGNRITAHEASLRGFVVPTHVTLVSMTAQHISLSVGAR